MLKKGPDWWIKISDFGISKRIESTALRTHIGTEPYMAPEIKGIFPMDDGADADTDTFTLAVDIWSVGVIAFRMVTGRLPFPDPRQLFNYVVKCSSFPAMGLEPADCADFVQKTMAASPHLRPTSQQALEHQWLMTRLSESNPNLHTSNVGEQSLDFSFLPSAQWSTNERETAGPSARSITAVPDTQPVPPTENEMAVDVGSHFPFPPPSDQDNQRESGSRFSWFLDHFGRR